ncbi:MAG: hypothetical protein ACREL5_05990, partial [Gemmatimonadales bacterium]
VEQLARWVVAPQLDGGRLRFTVPSRAVLPDIVRHLASSGADIFGVMPERQSLEELFVTIVGEDPGR